LYLAVPRAVPHAELPLSATNAKPPSDSKASVPPYQDCISLGSSPPSIGDRVAARDHLLRFPTDYNDLADALVQADPNRFQEVAASDYVKGIDY